MLVILQNCISHFLHWTSCQYVCCIESKICTNLYNWQCDYLFNCENYVCIFCFVVRKKKKHQNITLCEEWQGMLFGKPCSSDHQCKQCWWAPEPVGLGSKSSWSCCGILVYPHKKQGCFLAQLPPHDLNTCWFLSVLCPLNGCIFQVRQHMQIKNLKKIKITIYKTDQKKFSFIFF